MKNKLKKTICVLLNSKKLNGVYYSLTDFGVAFENLGYKVVYVETDSKKLFKQLEKLRKKSDIWFYFSHNLNGADIKTSGGHFFYDVADRWLVSYVDTPLNKYQLFANTGKKKIVLMSDHSQIALVERIINGNGIVGPFLSINVAEDLFRSKPKKIAQRNIDILFIGRVNTGKMFIVLDSKEKRRLLNWIARIYSAINQGTVEDFVRILIDRCWIFGAFGLLDKSFPSEASLMDAWKVSHLVKAQRKMFVIDKLAKLSRVCKICLVLDDTNSIDLGSHGDDVSMMSYQPWSRVVSLMAESKIVVVVNFKKYGVNDKVFSAMRSGAVVLSDKNEFLEEEFTDGEDIVFFDYKYSSLKDVVKNFINSSDLLQSIADRGRKKVEKKT